MDIQPWIPAHHILAPTLNPEQAAENTLLSRCAIYSPSRSDGGDSMGEISDNEAPELKQIVSASCLIPQWVFFLLFLFWADFPLSTLPVPDQLVSPQPRQPTQSLSAPSLVPTNCPLPSWISVLG